MNKKLVKGLGLILITALLFTGCGSDFSTGTEAISNVDTSTSSDIGTTVADSVTRIDKNSYGREQTRTEQNQNHLNQVQPAEKLDWSLERENLNQRLKRWNDPNKVSYLYTLSDTGVILGYYVIKGKVSSVNSKLTTTNQLIYNESSYYDSVTGVVESPDMDGSYGSNGDAVFFFLTDGTYMEYNGKYQLSDNPVKLSQEPLMTYEVKDEVKQ